LEMGAHKLCPWAPSNHDSPCLWWASGKPQMAALFNCTGPFWKAVSWDCKWFLSQ
jgi:hypothetical protein